MWCTAQRHTLAAGNNRRPQRAGKMQKRGTGWSTPSAEPFVRAFRHRGKGLFQGGFEANNTLGVVLLMQN